MKVKLTKSLLIRGKAVKKDAVVEVEERIGKEFIARNVAVPVKEDGKKASASKSKDAE